MPDCPTCRIPLETTHVGSVVLKPCSKCGGSLIYLPTVRQTIRKDVEDQLLAQARATKTQGTRTCPLCAQPMTLLTVPRGPRPIALDVCYWCQHVWFDSHEYEVLSDLYGLDQPPAHMLDHKWKWAIALLGLPVERQGSTMLRRPWVTWALSALIAAISIAVGLRFPALQYQFALVPAYLWRMGGITLLTSFFLHGGWLHLLGNLYFLIVFGDNVEDFLGKPRYLLLLMLATLAGNFLHAALDPNSLVPVIGASGGISGVVVFYGLQFPRARLLLMTRWLLFYPIRLRAIFALVLWFLLQLLIASQQLSGVAGVSALAHLGGAAVGVAFWLLWSNRFSASPPLEKDSARAAHA